MTAMAEKLIAKGIRPEEIEFQCAITKFLNNGGTVKRGHELLDGALGTIADGLVKPRNTQWHSLSTPPARRQIVQKPVQPRPPLSKERIERRRQMEQILMFGHKTGDGRDWADVGVHELDFMARDGALAHAIKSKIGVLTNAQRFQKLRELMSAESFNEVRKEAAV